jgi:hypothetical protein
MAALSLITPCANATWWVISKIRIGHQLKYGEVVIRNNGVLGNSSVITINNISFFIPRNNTIEPNVIQTLINCNKIEMKYFVGIENELRIVWLKIAKVTNCYGEK